MNIKSFLVVFLSLISIQIFAQDKKTVASKLNEATVFFRGAELTHSANAQLVKGDNEVFVEGLSPIIDFKSIKVKSTNNVVISGFEFSIDYLSSSKALTPVLKKISDSIAVFRANLDKVNIDIKINSNMLSYLQAGINKNVSGSEKGLAIDELVKTMDYYKSKSEEMETSQVALLKKKSELEMSINMLQTQLNQESLKGKTSGVLKLYLSAPYATGSTFTITYFTASASWIPYYDIKIASTDKPVTIVAKSSVTQTTGLDWERIKLNLSTATPSNGKIAPLFNAWFLQQQYIQEVADIPMAQNSYAYEKQMEEVQVVAFSKQKKETVVGSIAPQKPLPPLYVINGLPSEISIYEKLDKSRIKDTKVLDPSSAVAKYGQAASGGAIEVLLKSGMEDFVSQSDNAMNMVYNIDLPYSIPGNGKAQNIDLTVKETPAEYKYYCAPKLDTETYLLAEIPNWEKLGLLSGKANLTYDGTYIGETFIDANSTQEKLTLTLGSDKRVAVKREKMQDFSSVKFLGSDVLQVFTYKLTVKNNQNNTIKMVLKDQYPISTQKNIEVLLRKETTPWTVNKEDLGVITWEEELKPGETKTYQISYSVKYPKDIILNL